MTQRFEIPNLLIAVVVLVVLSPAFASGEDAAPKKPLTVFATPQAAFEAFANAQDAKDWPRAWDCLTPRLQEAEAELQTLAVPERPKAQVIDKTAIVYDRGNVIYVNRPSNADSLDSDDVMVTKLHGSQLCRLDVVRTHDRSSFFYTGFVGLEDFVPYRRVARSQ